MPVAMAPVGNRVENDIVLPEPAEMQGLVKIRTAMIGQAGKVHTPKIRQITPTHDGAGAVISLPRDGVGTKE
jgi:hypothetical protein